MLDLQLRHAITQCVKSCVDGIRISKLIDIVVEQRHLSKQKVKAEILTMVDEGRFTVGYDYLIRMAGHDT